MRVVITAMPPKACGKPRHIEGVTVAPLSTLAPATPTMATRTKTKANAASLEEFGGVFSHDEE
eukprot:5090661-Prorocentrum_lima.AAC.1